MEILARKIKSGVSLAVCQNYDSLCEDAVQKILFFSQESIREKGVFHLVLSGGSTPKGIYRLMGMTPYRDQFDWPRIHLFWGDERWVPPGEPRSNYRLVADTLLTKIDIPFENIHAISVKFKDPEEAAAQYEGELRAFFRTHGGGAPVFDLVMLGLGQDGHVASLFPGSKSLKEKKRLVVSSFVADIEETRITLTLLVINRARQLLFTVSGIQKADILRDAFAENQAVRSLLPVHRVQPVNGKVLWLLDKQAALRMPSA